MIETVLIFDAETTGTDCEKDRIIEVGAVLWSIKHRNIIECYSRVFHTDEGNDAAHINGISPEFLASRHVDGEQKASANIRSLYRQSDCIIAHNAPFDKEFVDKWLGAPEWDWIDSLADFAWPVESQSKSLINIALAHGVPVTSAHRALTDCLLLSSLFERIEDSGERINAAYERSLIPKFEYWADVPYARRDEAGSAGFHWDDVRRKWTKLLTKEDSQSFGFKCDRL